MASGVVKFQLDHLSGAVGHSEFSADVLTGGTKPPQVTLRGNSGFPPVLDIYASTDEAPAGVGSHYIVRVHMRFHDIIPSDANAIEINMYQEDAIQFSYPWLSS